MSFILIAAEVGFLVLDYIYHRYLNPPPPPQTDTSIKVPLTSGGSAYPIIYGTGRVREPILAWCGQPLVFSYDHDEDRVWSTLADSRNDGVTVDGTPIYALSMFFVLGLGFDSPNGTYNKLSNFYFGDLDFNTINPPWGFPASLQSLSGNGGYDDFAVVDTRVLADKALDNDGLLTSMGARGDWQGGSIQFFNGRYDQRIVNDNLSAGNYAANQMRVAGHPERIPAYRGMMCVFLFGATIDGIESGSQQVFSVPSTDSRRRTGENDSDMAWIVGKSSTPSSYSFEVSSFPPASLCSRSRSIGGDANPIDVFYDIMTNTRWRMGYDKAKVDLVSFRAAAETVFDEGLGYSRVIESGVDLQSICNEIMQHVDGTYYVDLRDGLLKICLVRADYDPLTVQVLDPSNVASLNNAAVGASQGVMNKLVVQYNSRVDGYITKTKSAQNQANAVGQGGTAIETTIAFPGCCTEAVAKYIATRELDARSRSIAKFDAIVSPQLRYLHSGSVVALNWPLYQWDRVYMRVAGVTRSPNNGPITLNLVQEVFQIYRNQHRGPVTGLGTGLGIG